MALENISPLFNCTYLSSCDEALKMAGQINPDFIFVDMNMPSLNGLECIKAIKQMECWRSIPLYLYSTSNDENMRKQAKALGAVECIKKPVSPDHLAQLLIQLIKLHNDFYQW